MENWSWTIIQQGGENLRRAQFPPQPLEYQGRAGLDRLGDFRLAPVVGFQHGRPLGKPGV